MADPIISDNLPPEVLTGRVKEDLEQYFGGEMLPGASDVLSGTLARLGKLGPAERLEELAKFLDGPSGGRWLDPEKTAGRSGKQPIRVALDRLAGMVGSESEEYYRRFATTFATMDAPKIMGRLAKQVERDRAERAGGPKSHAERVMASPRPNAVASDPHKLVPRF
jgi:hypothetical protein